MLFLFRFPAKQLYYYITAFLICQVLFSSFFKLFFQLLVTALLSCNFYIISHCLNFVKYFFKLFFKSSLSSRSSFQALLNVFPCVQIFLAHSRFSSTPVPDSFIIISPFFIFVNYIFLNFFNIFVLKSYKSSPTLFYSPYYMQKHCLFRQCFSLVISN